MGTCDGKGERKMEKEIAMAKRECVIVKGKK
jgi:hypothetical protein